MTGAKLLYGRHGHWRDAQAATKERTAATSNQRRLSRGRLKSTNNFHHFDERYSWGAPPSL
jgi:hypothetical protein